MVTIVVMAAHLGSRTVQVWAITIVDRVSRIVVVMASHLDIHTTSHLGIHTMDKIDTKHHKCMAGGEDITRNLSRHTLGSHEHTSEVLLELSHHPVDFTSDRHIAAVAAVLVSHLGSRIVTAIVVDPCASHTVVVAAFRLGNHTVNTGIATVDHAIHIVVVTALIHVGTIHLTYHSEGRTAVMVTCPGDKQLVCFVVAFAPILWKALQSCIS